jgi:NADH-quinone oxidoreductase subunit N
VLTSVVSVFFYLRIVVMMYMTDGSETLRPRVPAVALAGLALAMLAVLYLGVLPTTVIDFALESISTIL